MEGAINESKIFELFFLPCEPNAAAVAAPVVPSPHGKPLAKFVAAAAAAVGTVAAFQLL